MEKILIELNGFLLDENKLEYLRNNISKNENKDITISPENLLGICEQIDFDCNRNALLKMILKDFMVDKLDEQTLYKILKLYIFDFERNICFRILKSLVNSIQDTKKIENLYMYSNEKNIFLSLASITPKELEMKTNPESNILEIKKNTSHRCAT